MTSLSALSAASMTSPADRMKLQLQSLVSAGSVKAADQTALSGALDDIDAAMKSTGRPAAGTDPSAMKTKIDSLVDQEVTDGKLTADQATELKQVFATAAQSMGGPGGPRGAGGPPPPPPSGDDDDSDASASTTTTATSTDSSKQAIEALIAFLKQLEQTTTSATNYTASGTSASSGASSMLVDGTA